MVGCADKIGRLVEERESWEGQRERQQSVTVRIERMGK
jgi:hypothetical protein